MSFEFFPNPPFVLGRESALKTKNLKLKTNVG